MSDNDPENKENELDPNTQLEKRALQSPGIGTYPHNLQRKIWLEANIGL